MALCNSRAYRCNGILQFSCCCLHTLTISCSPFRAPLQRSQLNTSPSSEQEAPRRLQSTQTHPSLPEPSTAAVPQQPSQSVGRNGSQAQPSELDGVTASRRAANGMYSYLVYLHVSLGVSGWLVGGCAVVGARVVGGWRRWQRTFIA